MVEFADSEELEGWLKDKPREWSQIIAARAALRVIPYGTSPAAKVSVKEFPLAMFRATAIAWASRNYPAYDMVDAANAATNFSQAVHHVPDAAVGADANATYGAAFFAAKVAANASDPANAAATVVFSVAHHPFAGQGARAARASANAAATRAVSTDCDCLNDQSDTSWAARFLSNLPLWHGKPPTEWSATWAAAAEWLEQTDPNYSFWTDWLDRRIRGERSAFEIPGDKQRKEDKWLLRKIADATNDAFWNRGPEYVNAQLTEWLENARRRAEKGHDLSVEAQLIELLEADRKARGQTAVPKQVKSALRFHQGKDGKITLAPASDIFGLRKDQDARDRHKIALDDAKALLAACSGMNSAERLTSMLRAYVAAAGESVETMRQSIFVQKGERLRQELAQYEDPATDLPPLSDHILLDLRSVAKAHNMVVGLDPVLLELDTAQLPPDDSVGDVTKPEMQSFAADASDAEILQDEASEMLIEAVALTPDDADASDRRFRWSAGSCKNLVIEAFAIALNYPGMTFTATGTVSVFGLNTLFGSALKHAEFLVEHRTWIEERLGRHAPTWKALFVDLCDQLEKHTPLDSGKGITKVSPNRPPT